MSKSLIYLLSFALDTLLLDQLTKWWVTRNPQWLGAPDGFFQLTYTKNTGIAFSLPISGYLWYAMFLLLLIVGIPWARRSLNFDSILTGIASGLLIGGALGNLVDRLRFGYVVDFIKVGPWPLFNIADSAVCTAIVIFLIWQRKILKTTPT